MQQRHLNRQAYFNELANTSRKYYIDYIKLFHKLDPHTKILEIGCGEGGNLLPFAEAGCKVTGIDISPNRIKQAKEFFLSTGYESEFHAIDFLKMTPEETKKYDIILIHDVIGHISNKAAFISHIKAFIQEDGIIFWGFPAWQMPFGGHQQICKSRIISQLPYIHLLPAFLYRAVLKAFGETPGCVDELLDIKRCKMTIEAFEKLSRENEYTIVDRRLWFINPHYEVKFHLKPRKLYAGLAHIKYLRNFLATACFYITAFTPAPVR